MNLITTPRAGDHAGSIPGSSAPNAARTRVTAPARPMSDALFIGLAALLAMLARAPFLNWRGMWVDEIITWRAVRRPLDELIANRLENGHSPLYFLYAKWPALLGTEPWQLRLSSLLAAGLAAWMLLGAARALGLRRHWPALTLILVLVPEWFNLATTYRYMMPLIALGAAVLWAAALWMNRAGLRRALLLAALAALLAWTHHSAQFFLVPLALWLAAEGARQDVGEVRRVGDARRVGDVRRVGPGRVRGALAAAWPALLGLILSLPLMFLTRGHNDKPDPGLVDLPGLLDCAMTGVFGPHDLWPDWLRLPQWPVLLAEMTLLALALFLARRLARAPAAADLTPEPHAGSPEPSAGTPAPPPPEARAWRLILFLAVGIPAMLIIIGLAVNRFPLEPRYLALWSLPLILALALAWNAPARPSLRRAFRVLLLIVLPIQAAAVALDRGDHLRDAIQYVQARRHPGQAILADLDAVVGDGLDFYGSPAGSDLVKVRHFFKMKRDLPRLTRKIRREPSGFFIGYFNKASFARIMERLQHDGVILEYRRWQISRRTQVGAFITTDSARAWLDALPSPRRDWGPARDRRE